jgi:hypothetical protein
MEACHGGGGSADNERGRRSRARPCLSTGHDESVGRQREAEKEQKKAATT